MIFGIGIDTIEVPRIARSVETYGEQFLHRIYSEEELRYSLPRPHAAEHLAARFAAKEAFAKALGTGVRLASGHAGPWNAEPANPHSARLAAAYAGTRAALV